jgi:hypothetical protein
MKKFTLISHQWKAAIRSPAVSKSVGIRIFMGFIFFIVLLELFAGGYNIGLALAKNSENPVSDLLGYGFYLLLAVLVARYMLQKLPTFMVAPYLPLPIEKSKLVNFTLTKPLFNALNILPISFILSITMGMHEHLNAYTFWMIIAFVIVGDLFVNYLSIYIKRVQIKHEYVFYLFLGTIAVLLLLDQLKVVNLPAISSAIFMAGASSASVVIARHLVVWDGLLPQLQVAIQTLFFGRLWEWRFQSKKQPGKL